MTKKEDRRIQRTRILLSEALIDLIIEKGYEAITIQDIIDRANVGRSTFYFHFQDKEQLLIGNFAQLRDFIKEQIELNAEKTPKAPQEQLRFEFSLAMLQHVQGHKRAYRAVAHKQSGIVVMYHMKRMMADLVREEVDKFSSKADAAIPPEVAVEHIVNTFFTLLGWWMEQSPQGPAEKIDELFHKLTLSGLRDLLFGGSTSV